MLIFIIFNKKSCFWFLMLSLRVGTAPPHSIDLYKKNTTLKGITGCLACQKLKNKLWRRISPQPFFLSQRNID